MRIMVRSGRLLTSGRGINMGDGWETRRRREPGNDWIIVKLGAPGLVEKVEVDTCHYKGNYPDRCSLQAALVTAGPDSAVVTEAMFWPELMSEQKLEMDRIHTFNSDVIRKLGADQPREAQHLLPMVAFHACAFSAGSRDSA